MLVAYRIIGALKMIHCPAQGTLFQIMNTAGEVITTNTVVFIDYVEPIHESHLPVEYESPIPFGDTRDLRVALIE
jgi:hypothetical protein